MDPIEESDSNKRLETAQMVSAYMRANARRSVSKKNDPSTEAPRQEEPAKGSSSDQLDFSSEFTSQDMGLSSGGGASHLNWKRLIEDEEEEENKKKKSDQEEEDEKWEEWRQEEGGGSGSSKDQEQENEKEPPAEALEPVKASAPEREAKAKEATAQEPTPSGSPGQKEPKPSELSKSIAAGSLKLQGAEAALASVTSQLEAPSSLSASEPATASQSTAFAPVPLPPAPLPARLRPDSLAPISSLKRAVDTIAPDIAAVAAQLIVTPASDPGYEECLRLLARFGKGALRLCADSGVVVEILDEADLLKHWTLREMSLASNQLPSEGAYVIGCRTVLVDRRSLLQKPRYFHPALYYFAHAFDHAQGGDTFASRKAAAVVACFEASTRGQAGFDFVDELAAADPVRYFARSVAVYLGRDDCDKPLWSHQDLYDFDRSMYDYLQYLFQRLSK